MTRYWLSCRAMTVRVDVDDNERIVFAPRIAAKFIGQPLANIRAWMKQIGNFAEERLDTQRAIDAEAGA